MLQEDQFISYDGAEDYLCQEHTRNLFGQPDVLLVSEFLQVYQSSLAQTPEVRLVAALLKDGIGSYIKSLSAKPRRGKKSLANEAEEWIFNRDEEWPFSFENVCAILKIAPDYIRRILLQYKQEYTQAKESNGQAVAALPSESLRLAS